MRPWVSIQFLTFVLLAAVFARTSFASPSTDVPPQALDPKTGAPADKSRLDKNSTSITPVPLLGDEDPDRIVGTRVIRDMTWNLSLGLASGPFKDRKPAEQTQIYGFGATFRLPNEASEEFTLDLTESGLFGFHGQYKKYCCLGERYEPYWTLGVAGLYETGDLLPGLIKDRSYQAQAGVGLEDLFKMKRRLRAEVLIGQGLPGTSFFLRLGYAFDEGVISF